MASMADNYEINVARICKKKMGDSDREVGMHYCKIELPYDCKQLAEEKLEFLRNIFGDEFHLTMTHWVCRGYHEEENWK